jgi:hypothetical protein
MEGKRYINSPCTLREIYDWIMSNEIVDNRFVSCTKEIRKVMHLADWDKWQADIPKPREGSVLALLLLFKKACKDKKNMDVGLHMTLAMMNTHSALMDAMEIDFINGSYKLIEGKIKIIRENAGKDWMYRMPSQTQAGAKNADGQAPH